jgi:predicted Zn-dependent protease
VAQELARELAARGAAGAAAPVAAELDAEIAGRLRALGYVAGPFSAAVEAAKLGLVGGFDPTDGRETLAQLGRAPAAAAAGRLADALAALRPLGDGPVVAAQRAAVAVAAGDLAQAERDARLVLALEAERDDVRVILAQTLLAAGRGEEADAELARLEPVAAAAAPWVALRRAQALAAAGDRDAALDLLAAARERHPEEAALASPLASLFEAAGRLDEALEVREAALARDPGSAALQNDVAWTLARLGRDLARARALAEAAARGRPGEAAIQDTLAEIARAEQAPGGVRAP